MEFFAYQLIIKIPCISPTETSHIHVPVRSIKSSPRWKLSEMISLLEINVYNDRTVLNISDATAKDQFRSSIPYVFAASTA